MNATYYVTTSIPYVNARPHVGFALELVQADALARWHRLLGEEVFFLTGADENALKNVQAAAREGLTPRELCDRNAAVFQDLLRALDISADRFIRTSGEAHFRGASKFWGACRKGDIYRRRYRGLYCVGCEDFYLEKDLEEGRCPTHLTGPEIVEEENYFFRLSAYQERLEELIASGRLRVAPETRRNEALGFIRQGLQDFSISRVRERSGGWGIPTPGDPSQVIYVWFDALTNYLTGLGYGSDEGLFERF
ncbi:methionine--tRNA ligase, partial [bacterium]|nr:methionine--tRNA ligase [bacterium]